MADYDPNRPRPTVDAAAALPGDLQAPEVPETPPAAPEHDADAVAAAEPEHGADADAVAAAEPEHAADADAVAATAPEDAAEHGADAAPAHAAEHDAVAEAAAEPVHAADTDADPAPGPASHLLPRQAEPVDRRLLAAFGGAVAVGWVVAAVVAWWLWRRWRRR